ncbi:curli production assembly/transport component CsgF [Flavobacterium aquatile]|uniref:Curli production assembly/transport component CsgF n=1 Tax=Flavobacterium aquatile LMG 4008 = ATCC 11947 TaxID=1453498 RepID=A0A095SWF6_9FLAO|nr:curli production assembly/transport component CsgF [Flavobacterium aquatile]KGD68674.1 curli assembly protein CsgF [Flavobacterium aquatile LMG 4008 = ATCC 11947]OXA66385.1 curli assembly protein CsgF [Flavobacterium aquatile LMG 4008 = ATCC 11947]GEC79515.1 curli production assembly protein CsgF [Flavobacterium aquatile]
MKKLLLLFFLFISGFSFAQELVYKPRNPAFGGDTFNYQWLLSSAESQNLYKDKAAAKDERSEIERFTENLNAQLLNQVSRSLFTQQFGEEGISEGNYVFGSLSVEVYQSTGGLTINILDTVTGEETQVIIPNP